MNNTRTVLTARTLARRRSGPLATAVAFIVSAMIAIFSGPAAVAGLITWTNGSTDMNAAASWGGDCPDQQRRDI